jgi:hypothetical protein
MRIVELMDGIHAIVFYEPLTVFEESTGKAIGAL